MSNRGGGPRWGTMPRATCPRCGLTKPVGILQVERNGGVCGNEEKCKRRAERRRLKQKREAGVLEGAKP